MKPSFAVHRVVLVVAAVVTGAPIAHASQYPLEQATAIVPTPIHSRLKRAGVRTTEDFLKWGRTPEGRRLLADRVRLSVEQVDEWVCLADLLRVRGIGPDVARLLHGVGIRTLADLQKADPAVAASAIRDYNHRTHLSTNPPGAESLRYWIDLSRTLPVLLVLD